MIPPKRSNLPSLQSNEPEVFKRFLIAGLVGFFGESKGRHSFGEAAPYIGNNSDISDDLQDIHDCLEIAEKEVFQEGVVLAFASMVNFPKVVAYPVTIALISLAGKVQATSFLPMAPRVVRLLAKTLDGGETSRIVTTAFEAVLNISVPVPTAENCLLELSEIHSLPPRLSAPALLALASVAPVELPRHLARLWPQLDKVLGWTDPTSDSAEQEEGRRTRAREALISEVFSRVTVEDFVQTLAPRTRRPGSVHLLPSDWEMASDWWFQTLNSGHRKMAEIIARCTGLPIELQLSGENNDALELPGDLHSQHEADVGDIPAYMVADIYRRESEP